MRDSRVSRRDFIGLLSVAAGAVACGAPATIPAADGVRRETANLVLGPFYPQVKPLESDADLTIIRGHTARAAGQVVRVSGRVVNLRGEPVREARIEVWQANTNGRYVHDSDPNTGAALDPHFQGYALLRTDDEGRYAFTTIKPGPYPAPLGAMRAPHIHFDVQGRIDRKVTQLFFPGERLNDQDRHLRSARRPETLIANVSARAGELVARWDIVLTSG